eukprot:2858729-Rhodomonas_salina.2
MSLRASCHQYAQQKERKTISTRIGKNTSPCIRTRIMGMTIQMAYPRVIMRRNSNEIRETEAVNAQHCSRALSSGSPLSCARSAMQQSAYASCARVRCKVNTGGQSQGASAAGCLASGGRETQGEGSTHDIGSGVEQDAWADRGAVREHVALGHAIWALGQFLILRFDTHTISEDSMK